MQKLIKNLLTLGITVSLSDREVFIKKVSGLIEEYRKNPEEAEKWAEVIAKSLEEMKENFRLQRNIANSFPGDLPSKENIEQLTKALNDLTKELHLMKKE